MRFRVDHKLFLSKGLLPAKISEIRGPRSRPVLDKICACRTRETASTSGARCGSAAQASILRYYAQDRRQRTEFLCKRDEKHDSKTCKPVRDIASKVMARVNSGALAAAESPTVAEFWDGTYLPFAEKNLRPSTVHSYGDLGERHLQPHFGDARLATYRSSDATAFLTGLSAKLGRNSVNHVRSLMSGIFSHACALGKAERNPMREAKVLGKPKATAPRSTTRSERRRTSSPRWREIPRRRA
jgi:hypothetical protein